MSFRSALLTVNYMSGIVMKCAWSLALFCFRKQLTWKIMGIIQSTKSEFNLSLQERLQDSALEQVSKKFFPFFSLPQNTHEKKKMPTSKHCTKKWISSSNDSNTSSTV